MAAVYRYPAKLKSGSRVVATLGNFDGVHLGHQALFARLKELKNSAPAPLALLVSFYPHPAVVLGKAPSIPRLSGLHDEVKMLDRYSVDGIYMLHFTKALSQMRAEEFIERILIGHLNVTDLVIGPDARIGKGGEGTAALMQKCMTRHGRHVEVLPYCEFAGERISSRKTREALSAGDVESAARMLGRPYMLRGRVVRGMGRGKAIGFPTANLKVLGRAKLIPAGGVYACRARAAGVDYGAVANLGTRPTFEKGSALQVEAHLLDAANADLYGQRVELSFLKRLRAETKFPSADALRGQIEKDIAAARGVLAGS